MELSLKSALYPIGSLTPIYGLLAGPVWNVFRGEHVGDKILNSLTELVHVPHFFFHKIPIDDDSIFIPSYQHGRQEQWMELTCSAALLPALNFFSYSYLNYFNNSRSVSDSK